MNFSKTLTNTLTVSFVEEGDLKFDLSTVTLNDPNMNSDQKFLNTELLSEDKFTKVLPRGQTRSTLHRDAIKTCPLWTDSMDHRQHH